MQMSLQKICTFNPSKRGTMKRIVFIAICVLGLLSFSSCRSTSSPCGLAENSFNQTEQLQLLAKSTASEISDLI